MAAKPRTYVAAPDFTPLPFGLLTALADSIRRPADNHWQMGVNYEPVCAQSDTTFGDCFAVSGTGLDPVGEPPSKTATESLQIRGATPFTVFTEIDCSAVGFWDRANDLVRESFTQSEQEQVERAFWTGLAGGQPVVFPHLAEDEEIIDNFGILLQTAATVVSGNSTPVDIVVGLAHLESELASCYDGVGVIHAPRSLLPFMAAEHLIVRENGSYRTVGGNLVVFGAGYTGSGPDGVVPSGSAWMYATGAMFIYQSEPLILEPTGRNANAFDRTNNTVRAIAERTYVLGWDCCHLAVHVETVI